MFGKKKTPMKMNVSANFEVIPQDFYGTHDPVIHYNNLSKVSTKKDESYSSKVSLIDILKNKKVLIIIISILFLGAVGGIVWYYLVQAGIITKKEPITPVVEQVVTVEETPTVEEIPVQESTTTEEVIPTSTPEEIVETVNQEIEIDFPRIVLTNSVDLDNDALTDLEEEIFGTDSGTSDTDEDGFYDGQEINNLYNPRGIAPVKLIDSGLITEYANPIWQYRIYYPATWQIGEVDTEYRQVIFSAPTGDYIEVLVFQKEANETFENWFTRKGTNQRITDLQTFQNRFQETARRRQDSLVNYFVRDNNVYVITYHPIDQNGFIPFRHVIQMSVQSFRPQKSLVILPDQKVLPPSLTEKEIEDIFSANQNTNSTSSGNINL